VADGQLVAKADAVQVGCGSARAERARDDRVPDDCSVEPLADDLRALEAPQGDLVEDDSPAEARADSVARTENVQSAAAQSDDSAADELEWAVYSAGWADCSAQAELAERPEDGPHLLAGSVDSAVESYSAASLAAPRCAPEAQQDDSSRLSADDSLVPSEVPRRLAVPPLVVQAAQRAGSLAVLPDGPSLPLPVFPEARPSPSDEPPEC
jgi:hypothetical protein